MYPRHHAWKLKSLATVPYLNPLTEASGEGMMLARMIHYQRIDNINTVNVPELNGQTPLFGAILSRDSGCVHALLNFGALSNITDNDGVFPLLLAVVEPCDDMADLLLLQGADPNQSRQSTGTRPVHTASRHGNTDVLHLLIRYNADLNAEDYDGKNALCIAASEGHTEIVEILVDNGVDITMAAVHAASDSGHYRLADFITENMLIQSRVRLARMGLDEAVVPHKG